LLTGFNNQYLKAKYAVFAEKHIPKSHPNVFKSLTRDFSNGAGNAAASPKKGSNNQDQLLSKGNNLFGKY
jgi:hypothetical protein